jgi:EpsI family protein
MTLRSTWLPAILLTLGAAASFGAGAQRAVPLQAPLGDVVPSQLQGLSGIDKKVSAEEQRIAGMDDYVLRVYGDPHVKAAAGAAAAAATFSVYVGYYEKQTRGHTIHSPKNCLPGAGWEALTASTTPVATANGPVQVTKYLLKRGEERAVVLYWYQGRGRIEANEYRVKWNLLKDAAVRRRSDEALVRVVVPVSQTEETAVQIAGNVATVLIPTLAQALPE